MDKIFPFVGSHTEKTGKEGFSFYCPGCKYHHAFYTKGGKHTWTWNGSLDKPTFSPSLVINKGRANPINTYVIALSEMDRLDS